MPFDVSLRNMLEQYTNNPPSRHTQWSGPWTAILHALFPFAADYMISPQRRTRACQDLIYTVERISISDTPPTRLRTVLIVDLNTKYSQHFERGRDVIMQRIERKAQMAFEGTAVQKVYWIGAIGPHWRYGEKEDGQDLRPLLVEWHHVVHDEASYHGFLQLVDLVAALEVNQPGI